MTGNAADADDLVQETFVRALESPPRRLDEPLRPWLVRVAINLSRDLLRKRRRRAYAGEWLPSPVPTGAAEDPASYEPPAPSEDSPAARYDMIESISMAFLLALEALTPTARAVLLLRDVFEYSTAETAEAIGISEASAKVHLHRARRRMDEYDKGRVRTLSDLTGATQRALEQFLFYLGARNVEGLERLLTEDVVSISDGGGEVAAAMRTVRGRSRVMRLMMGLLEKAKAFPRASFASLNGSPAVVLDWKPYRPGIAPRFTLQVEVDGEGHIRRLFTVLAPSKLRAISQPG
jgi:RNA polymerase sigma-70 factor (ECF subfamily)